MKKIVCSLFTLLFLSLTVFAQTNKEGIDRRIKDPKTAEQAGKADVYILKKQTIDSLDQKTPPASNRKKTKKPNKKKKI